MFRALLFPPNTKQLIMEAPVGITLFGGKQASAVPLSIQTEAIFTTAVGHSGKRTLASWHVTTPQEIVEHMFGLVTATATTTAIGDGKEGKCSCK